MVDWNKLDHLSKTNPEAAVQEYKALLTGTHQESALLKLAQLYTRLAKTNELAELVKSSRNFLTTLSKAKANKIIRTLIDHFSDIPGALPTQVQLCKESIDWAIEEKRIFLRQSLETRLCALYLENKMYSESLALIATLLKELKRLDDKNVLVEVQLLESRVYHAVGNLPKSRAALTSGRTSANAIYCPPLTQAALDLQSGILHAEEKDYKTAYSYFYETLENFSSLDDPRAIRALKYMLLCKIMLGLPDDVFVIVNGKIAQKYSGKDIDAMKAVATAYQHRSLQEFEQCMAKFPTELTHDVIIRSHLTELYDTLMKQNLLALIEPFSRVEIAHIAEKIQLSCAQVEAKLSQMILDKQFFGILDQGAGCLEVYEEPVEDKTFESALETLKQMGHVVDSLYIKAAQI